MLLSQTGYPANIKNCNYDIYNNMQKMDWKNNTNVVFLKLTFNIIQIYYANFEI